MVKRLNIQSLFSYSDAQSPWFRYGLAVLAVAAAALATQTVPVIGQRAAFMFYFIAIIQVSYWLGRYPGLSALILSLVSVNRQVLLPIWTLEPGNAAILNIGFILLSAIIIRTAIHHRQLATKLWFSQQDLNHAQAVAQTGSWRMNVRNNQLYWSDENYRIFGVPTGMPLTYDTFLSTVHPDDRDYVDQKWRAALSGEPYDIDHRIIVRGQVKWVREKAVLEFDPSGKLLGGFGTTQDITELRHNQSMLLENQLMLAQVEQQYAGIVKSAMDAIITIDADQRILVFNAAAEKMFGCTANQAIGESLNRFIPERFRHNHGTHINAFAHTRISSRKMGFLGAVSGLHSNGEEFPIEVSISQTVIDGKKTFTAILRDITERKLAEWALRDRESELRLIMDATPALIAYFDTGLRYRRINKAYESWFCMAPEQILGHSVQEIILDKAWHAVRPYFDRALAGERVSFDSRIPYGTGKPRWVQANYIPDKDTTGRVKGVVVHIMDIEDRKQGELERQKFISLADSSQEFIGMCDMNFKPFYVNAAGLRLVGLESPEQAFQTPVQEFFFPEDQRFITEEFFPRVLREKSSEVEIRFRHFQTGAAIWMIYNVFFIEDSKGDAIGLATVSRDITARTLAEVALRESEARLALVIEAVKAGYMDWDLNSKKIYFSPEWKAQLGYEDHELPNQWAEKVDRLHPDDRAVVVDTTENCLAGRQSGFELEFRLRHKDGPYRWIHTRSVVLRDENNRPYRLLGLNLDITDYKQRNELMMRRNKMEQSFQLYVASQTAAAIAHELNQPLTAISYYADVAQELLQTGNPNPHKLSEIVEKCSQQALRAGSVIRQLMAILHKGESISEPIDINVAVREAVSFVMTDGQLGAFKINLDLAATLPLATANNLQIQKVLINLLHNGLESMRESGSNVETIEIITRPATDDPSFAQVTVSDCGKGVADVAMLKTIFQPFHTTKSTGLGMGLAISRALIEAHNGKMWAEQNTGHGISIHFTLPFAL